MSTQEMIKEINTFSLDRKIWIVQEVLKSIKQQENSNSIRIAAEKLYEDYKNDEELTIFTQLDFAKFYETK